MKTLGVLQDRNKTSLQLTVEHRNMRKTSIVVFLRNYKLYLTLAEVETFKDGIMHIDSTNERTSNRETS